MLCGLGRSTNESIVESTAEFHFIDFSIDCIHLMDEGAVAGEKELSVSRLRRSSQKGKRLHTNGIFWRHTLVLFVAPPEG